MKDEIKLSKKEIIGICEFLKIHHFDNSYLLLDYITNLQESDSDKQLEIMKLKDKLEQQRKEYQETYKDVRIEIKEKDEIITNLQEEVNKLTAESTEWESKCYDLQLENEKLKELCDKYEEEHSTTFEYWRHLIKEDYKSRNEKAIEYLPKIIRTSSYELDEKIDNLENILNGGDE